jgi:hypothetical protein
VTGMNNNFHILSLCNYFVVTTIPLFDRFG